MSLKIPVDMDILSFCQETAKNRYQIAKQLGLDYTVGVTHVDKLIKMELLFVSREERGKGPGMVQYLLVTTKGTAMLRGYKEGLR